MGKIINQFRRIYSDNGSGDVDFAAQEERLRIANENLKEATSALIRASERLNTSALGVGALGKKLH